MASWRRSAVMLGAVAAFVGAVATPCFGKSGNAVIVETAPLRGMMGHPALRAELLSARAFAVGAAFESADAPSERQDFKDQTRTLNLDGLWYPVGAPSANARSWQGAPFLGAGLGWEEADIGRERPRDAVTWARTASDESHDRWVNHDSYLTATQTVGYRVASTRLVTASLRLMRDEVLMANSRVERDSVYSRDPDLSGEGRKAVMTRIVLHAGLLFE